MAISITRTEYGTRIPWVHQNIPLKIKVQLKLDLETLRIDASTSNATPFDSFRLEANLSEFPPVVRGWEYQIGTVKPASFQKTGRYS